MKRYNNCLAYQALFSFFTVLIYAPFEMYTANKNEFWFGLHNFWWIPIFFTVFAAVVAYILGCLLKGLLRQIYIGILFSLGVCFYIQGNFLTLRVGQLNGSSVGWTLYKGKMILNLVIWLVLIAAITLLFALKYKTMKKICSWAALLLMGMQLISLIVLVVPCITEEISNKGKALWSTDKDLMSVSSDGNILVFVVDMCDEEYFQQALSEKLELANGLDGFVHYTNAVGGYEYTRYAIPLLLTGKKFLNEMPRREWQEQVGAERQYWDVLLENGYEISVYSDDDVIPSRMKEESINCLNVDYKINYYKNFTMDLYRFVMCKYFPDIIKPYIWMSGTEFSRWKELDSEHRAWYFDTNIPFSQKLRAETVKALKDKKQFKFIHFLGSHEPFDLDENGGWTPGINTDAITCTKGSFALIEKYLNDLKEADAYDSSAIIIVADHGSIAEKNTNPVLLVKKPGARGSITENDAPVSHWEFAATVLDLAGVKERSEWQNEKSILEIRPEEERNRLHYHTEGLTSEKNERMIEYVVEDANNRRESYHATGFQYTVDGEKIFYEE